MNADIKNEANIYTASVAEEDEQPPPNYYIINHLI